MADVGHNELEGRARLLDAWKNLDANPVEPVDSTKPGEPPDASHREPHGLSDTVGQDKVGTKCDIKELYASEKVACDCCMSWSDERRYNDDEEEAAKRRESRNEFALIQRRVPHGGPGEYKTHSIEVKSPWIKERLSELFDGYSSIDTSATAPTLSFKPPYSPFLHRWDALNDAIAKENDPRTLDHLKTLQSLLNKELEGSLDVVRHFEKTGCIPFDDLPLAFIPGEPIIQVQDGVMRAAILKAVDLGDDPFRTSKYYSFTVDVIESDGDKFGALETVWELGTYQEGCPLVTLSVFPLRIHAQREKIKADLTERGRKFERLRGQHFSAYNGRVTVYDKYWKAKGFSIAPGLYAGELPKRSDVVCAGRVLIDGRAYFDLQDTRPPNLRSLNQIGMTAIWTHLDERGQVATAGNEEADSSLTEEQCFIATSTVKGFAIEGKFWAEFDVASIQEIRWDTNAIQDLVISEDEKSLLLALVDSENESLEDTAPYSSTYTSGKGKGVILLLHGPPGVGKTLTAESVAEHVRRPLYRLSAGDLGTDVSTVEIRLKEGLDRASTFNAVLLIDEADVYLEKRSTNSLERNELVSVFLRLLEYYQGIMILTTNRVKNIDAAFESRLDIILAYPELDSERRARIWRLCLKTVKAESTLADEDAIEQLAEKRLNGRQIKSAIKISSLLAAREKKVLGLRHIRLVVGLREKAREVMGCQDDPND